MLVAIVGILKVLRKLGSLEPMGEGTASNVEWVEVGTTAVSSALLTVSLIIISLVISVVTTDKGSTDVAPEIECVALVQRGLGGRDGGGP